MLFAHINWHLRFCTFLLAIKKKKKKNEITGNYGKGNYWQKRVKNFFGIENTSVHFLEIQNNQ